MFAIPFNDTHRDKMRVIFKKMNVKSKIVHSISDENSWWSGKLNYVYICTPKIETDEIIFWLEFCLFKLAIDLGVKPEDVIKYWMLNKEHPVDYLYKIFEQKQLQ